jgi:TatD DNase family protein
MKIFDTHAHYDDSAFDRDRDELLSKALPEAGVGYVLNAGADPDDLPIAFDIAEKYGYVYLSVGAHPHYAQKMSDERILQFKTFISREKREKARKERKIVAVGEIGLDYHYDGHDKEAQRYWFLRQLEFAGEEDLPVIIHSRDADADMLEILSRFANVTPLLQNRKRRLGVLHCFAQNLEMAERYIEMGFFIGIGGVVTYKNAQILREVAEGIPLERILLETDCPYLSPAPLRGIRNNSQNLSIIARKIGEIKQICHEKVINVTTENALSLFDIK